MKKMVVILVLAFLVLGCNNGNKAKTEEPTQAPPPATATPYPTYTPLPTYTPVPSATPAPPTNTPVPPTNTPAPPKDTATPVPEQPTELPVSAQPETPPTAAPQMSDREALLTFVNQIWPLDLKASAADVQLDKDLANAKTKNDVMGAVDKWVKATEPLIPQIKAISAPNVPFAPAFMEKYVKAMDGYFDATKRINWGLVKNDDTIFNQAVKDLNAAAKDFRQSGWELKAAVEKQGLKYNSAKKVWE